MTKNFTHERSLHVKRSFVLVLAVLMATVLLAAGCGGGGTSISGKYIYKAAPAGQGPVLDFKSNGTVAISVPAQVNPQTNQPTPAQNLNWYYETVPCVISHIPASCDKRQLSAWLSQWLTFIVLYLVVGLRNGRRE